MKQFITIKTGYTYSKNFGCTNEFFTCIVLNDNKHDSFCFKGLYGAEDRVNRILKDNEYQEIWANAPYGQLTRNDTWKNILDEYEAIDQVKKIVLDNK